MSGFLTLTRCDDDDMHISMRCVLFALDGNDDKPTPPNVPINVPYVSPTRTPVLPSKIQNEEFVRIANALRVAFTPLNARATPFVPTSVEV